MQYKGLTTVLTVMLALSTVSCRSSRTVTQQTHNEAIHDTLREVVTLTLHDTIRETTTITIQTNNDGDTTKLITITDREKTKITDYTVTTLNHQTAQTETTNNTKENTTPINPIQPTNPKSPIKPIAISFLLGLILIPIIKLCRRLKK